MKFRNRLIFLIILSLLINTTPVFAADIHIITPYWGMEDNTYTNIKYGLKLKDSAPMQGFYVQSVNPEKYQWNLFLYQTEDINYSDLQGINFIYDYYFGADNNVKNVIGAGINYLTIDMAGVNVPMSSKKLDAFDLDLKTTSLYLRLGRYYNFGEDKLHSTLLPWFGGQLDQSRGNGRVDFPGPGVAVFNVNEDQYSWIAGMNLKVTFYHFLQLEAKRSVTYNSDAYLNKVSAMVNLFLSRNVGLSYRYNDQETSTGKDSYNLLGLAVVF